MCFPDFFLEYVEIMCFKCSSSSSGGHYRFRVACHQPRCDNAAELELKGVTLVFLIPGLIQMHSRFLECHIVPVGSIISEHQLHPLTVKQCSMNDFKVD